MSEVPDWVVPGQPVSVETRDESLGRTVIRTWTVDRVGPRYIIVKDSMDNERKFQTNTLSHPATAGRTETLVPPDRNTKE